MLVEAHTQQNNKLISSIYFYPLGFHIGNQHIEEHGLGIYQFNYKRPFNFELGYKLSRRIINSYSIEGGISVKYWNLEFEYIINDPFFEEEIFAHEERYIRKIMTSPNVGLLYKKNKIKIAIGLEANMEINSESNVISGQSPIYVFFDPNSQRSANLTISENNVFLNDFTLFLTPTLTLGYQILSRFSIELNGKIKPYGEWPLYRLKIEGKTPDLEDGLYLLNDVRILNKIVFIHLGVSYSLNKKSSK